MRLAATSQRLQLYGIRSMEWFGDDHHSEALTIAQLYVTSQVLIGEMAAWAGLEFLRLGTVRADGRLRSGCSATGFVNWERVLRCCRNPRGTG